MVGPTSWPNFLDGPLRRGRGPNGPLANWPMGHWPIGQWVMAPLGHWSWATCPWAELPWVNEPISQWPWSHGPGPVGLHVNMGRCAMGCGPMDPCTTGAGANAPMGHMEKHMYICLCNDHTRSPCHTCPDTATPPKMFKTTNTKCCLSTGILYLSHVCDMLRWDPQNIENTTYPLTPPTWKHVMLA